jgi:hypothetical protein
MMHLCEKVREIMIMAMDLLSIINLKLIIFKEISQIKNCTA